MKDGVLTQWIHYHSFGKDKVNILGSHTRPILLALSIAFIVWESCQRLLNPINIAFDQAIVVDEIGSLISQN